MVNGRIKQDTGRPAPLLAKQEVIMGCHPIAHLEVISREPEGQDFKRLWTQSHQLVHDQEDVLSSPTNPHI